MREVLTRVTIGIHFGGAGWGPRQGALDQGFRGCAVLGLLDAGSLGLPHLLPQCQLHSEDLQGEERRGEGEERDRG